VYELKKNYTIIIVTHNMQQAARVSDYTAFLLYGRIDGIPSDEKKYSPCHRISKRRIMSQGTVWIRKDSPMERHFQKKLKVLNFSYLKWGSLVEENFRLSVQAVQELNIPGPQKVIGLPTRGSMRWKLKSDNCGDRSACLAAAGCTRLAFYYCGAKNQQRHGTHQRPFRQYSPGGDYAGKLSTSDLFNEIPQMMNIARQMLKDAVTALFPDGTCGRKRLETDDRLMSSTGRFQKSYSIR